MSTTPSIDASTTAPELTLIEPPSLSATSQASVLLCLPPMDADTLHAALAAVAAAFPGEDVQVASPGRSSSPDDSPSVQMLTYTGERMPSGWVLTAADYAAAASLAGDDKPRITLLLGDAASAIRPDLLRRFVDCARSQSVDLVLPRFTLGPGDGLVNSAILYPLTRALFGTDIRFPLPIDVALSTRMLQRLASSSQRQVALGQGSALIWPVAEACVAGFSVRQVDAASGPPSVAGQDDFNTLFNNVSGSLFTDIEARATFWQRARSLSPRSPQPPLPAVDPTAGPADIQPMIESFQLAQANLQELWALVLPPQSRLALKKLSREPAGQFALEPDLWARIVYDFALAFHLRTLNRGHLLGALIPLYLAWVASHLSAAANDSARALRHTDDTAAAFDSEKPYLVARWRWPDRFNP
jgi:hypothetical protein